VAKPRWRDYRTLSGRRPVRDFLMAVPSADRAAVVAAMEDVAAHGLAAARHLRGDVWEVRADGDRIAYRVLFSAEGARSFIFLALHAFAKRTRRTPPAAIELAERRLADWRARGSG
jgi:phage-related protein